LLRVALGSESRNRARSESRVLRSSAEGVGAVDCTWYYVVPTAFFGRARQCECVCFAHDGLVLHKLDVVHRYITLPTTEMLYMLFTDLLESMYRSPGFLRATKSLNRAPGSWLRTSIVINCTVEASFSVSCQPCAQLRPSSYDVFSAKRIPRVSDES
jgi:hypothetical protein